MRGEKRELTILTGLCGGTGLYLRRGSTLVAAEIPWEHYQEHKDIPRRTLQAHMVKSMRWELEMIEDAKRDMIHEAFGGAFKWE